MRAAGGSCISQPWGKPGLSLGGPAVLRGSQQVSPSPGGTGNAGNCSKQFWLRLTLQTVVRTWAQVSLSLRTQGQHQVRGHLLGKCHKWHPSVGSLLPNVPEQGRGQEAAGGCSLSPAEPSQAAQTAADISFLLGLCWCRHLTPCTCLCTGFLFSSSEPNTTNHDCPGLSLLFSLSALLLTAPVAFPQALGHSAEIWCKLKFVEDSVIIHLAGSQRSEP